MLSVIIRIQNQENVLSDILIPCHNPPQAAEQIIDFLTQPLEQRDWIGCAERR